MKSHQQEQDPTIILNQQQAELVDIGAQLNATRQEKGLSLEEMVAITKIGPRVLVAIEKADLDALPEPVYTQGFIRKYADALGCNGVELASKFPIGQSNVTLKTIGNSSRRLLRPVHMYSFYVLLIIGSVMGLSQVLNSEPVSRQPKTEKTAAVTDAQTPPTASKAIASLQTVSDTFNRTSDTENVQIGVSLKQTSWIEVIADGKTTFAGTLPQGTQRTWKAQEEITLKAGNAGGVFLSVNKQKAKQMGEPGRVEKLTFAAKPE